MSGRAPYGGAWIEILIHRACSGLFPRSRPVWGAWIEMLISLLMLPMAVSRAPYGARGLKCGWYDPTAGKTSRAPYGARGLKCVFLLDYCGALCYD